MSRLTTASTELAKEVNDDVLAAGILVVCSGSSVGAVYRALGRSPDRLRAWQEFCFPPELEVVPLDAEGDASP